MIGRGLLAILILAFQLVASTLAADDLAGGVERLLAAGAKPSAKALATARAEYKPIGQRPDFDARAKYAFCLVLVQQRQLVEARKLLDEILAEKPEMLPAWQAKIWADLVSRAYPAALTDMRAAADQLAALNADSGSKNREERQALTRFLGRAVGFLQASQKTGIPAAGLKAGRDEILAKVETDRTQFLISEQMIGTEVAALDVKLGVIAQTQGAIAAKQQEEQQDKKREVGKQAAETDFEILKSQADAALQMKSLEWDVESLQLKVAKAQYALNAIDLAIVMQYSKMQEAAQFAQRAEQDAANGRIVSVAQGQANGFAIGAGLASLQRLNVMHVNLYNQLVPLKVQLEEAIRRRSGAVDENQENVAELETKARKLKHDEKKLEYAVKHGKAPAAVGGKRALAEQRRSFGSFEPFAFEEERDRVLAWFEKS